MRKQKKVTIFDPALTHITALSCTKVLSSLWSVLCDSATPNCWLTENSGPLCEQRCSIMCHVEYLHMHKDMHTHTRMIHRPPTRPHPPTHTHADTHTQHTYAHKHTHTTQTRAYHGAHVIAGAKFCHEANKEAHDLRGISGRRNFFLGAFMVCHRTMSFYEIRCQVIWETSLINVGKIFSLPFVLPA